MAGDRREGFVSDGYGCDDREVWDGSDGAGASATAPQEGTKARDRAKGRSKFIDLYSICIFRTFGYLVYNNYTE